MAGLHAMLGIVVMAAAVLFGLAALLVWRVGHGREAWIERLRFALEGLLVIQVVIGVITFLLGSRPTEGLHLVYGVAILAVLPLASSFASEAPPSPRSGVLAIGGLVIVLLAWRLLSTG